MAGEEYIYRQCPHDRKRGEKEEQSCGNGKTRLTTQQQFSEIAFWWRDMGPKIRGSANFWAYMNTMRGVYYSEYNFSGDLEIGSETDLCSFNGVRTFYGDGATGKHEFTGCGCWQYGCDNPDRKESDCCGTGFLCPPDNKRDPTYSVTAYFYDWWFDKGVPQETPTDGPSYSSEIHWKFPKFCFDGGPCTDYCLQNPPTGLDAWGYWSSQDDEDKPGEWSYNGNAFVFNAKGYFKVDSQWPCGHCYWAQTDPCPTQDNPGRKCCCSKGSHDIWTNWGMSVTLSRGQRNSNRCAVN